MDVLRKELNAFYESQGLREEILDYTVLQKCRNRIGVATEVENDCRVITDAAADSSIIFGGSFGKLIGLSDFDSFEKEVNSSDEDVIYQRIHPEDLVEKRMLEYDFFKFIDSLPFIKKIDFKATCHIRIKERNGKYLYVENSTRILRLSPKGKVWLILCCYSISPMQEDLGGIEARIINSSNGDIINLHLAEKRRDILTAREKEILSLIRDGKLSKEIADTLGISIHTVNRHRQNILEKLSVGNSVEAIKAATLMKLL